METNAWTSFVSKLILSSSRRASKLRLHRRPSRFSASFCHTPTRSFMCAGVARESRIPLGDLNLGLTYENHTSYPAPGQMIVYPGGISETEILLAYGGVHFASKMGQLAGNHFLTITSDLDKLAELGRAVFKGTCQNIRIEAPNC